MITVIEKTKSEFLVTDIGGEKKIYEKENKIQ